MESINDSIGFQLGQTMRIIVKRLETNFEQAGIDLTIEQFGLLHLLSINEDLIQQDVAELLDKDKSAILRQIDVLESKRWMVRIADATDRRKKNLMLTKKGMETLEQALAIEQNLTTQLRQGVSTEQWTLFEGILRKIQQNGS